MNGIALGLSVFLAVTGVSDQNQYGPEWNESPSVKVHLKWVDVNTDGTRRVYQSRHVPVTTQTCVHVSSNTGECRHCLWNVQLSPMRGRYEIDLSAQCGNDLQVMFLGNFVGRNTFHKQALVRTGQVNRWVVSQNEEGIPTSWVEFTVEQTERFDPSEAAEPVCPRSATPSSRGLPAYHEPF